MGEMFMLRAISRFGLAAFFGAMGGLALGAALGDGPKPCPAIPGNQVDFPNPPACVTSTSAIVVKIKDGECDASCTPTKLCQFRVAASITTNGDCSWKADFDCPGIPPNVSSIQPPALVNGSVTTLSVTKGVFCGKTCFVRNYAKDMGDDPWKLVSEREAKCDFCKI